MIRVTITTTGLDDLVEDAKRKMMLDLHRELVMTTPVDTGRARAGWTVDAHAGTIENNVEYVDALNKGHSKQAPAGFIESAIDKITRL